MLGAAGTYTPARRTATGGSWWWARRAGCYQLFLRFNGNRDLFLNMLNWLTSDEDLISIRPKEPEDRRLNMNARQMSMLFYESIVFLIPLLIVWRAWACGGGAGA